MGEFRARLVAAELSAGHGVFDERPFDVVRIVLQRKMRLDTIQQPVVQPVSECNALDQATIRESRTR